MNIDVSYGMTRRLRGLKLEDAKARTIAALQAEGFGVLTEIDVQATLKKKLDVNMAPYLILGACNQKLAHAALEKERTMLGRARAANVMPRCPIGSPGITITATAGSGSMDLSLLASKPEDVQEVRRRTHASLAK